MNGRFLVVILSGLMQTACIPAMVPKSPGVFGSVTDGRTHKPVAGASVAFPSLSVPGATTDSQGSFDLPRQKKLGIIVFLPLDPFGRVPLSITHPRYEPFNKLIPLYAPHARIDATLTPKH